MENLLSVSNLHVDYKNFCLNDISFDLKEGEIVGFIGENGAGKSTTINAIMGITGYQHGIISYKGTQITEQNIVGFRNSIGYIGEFHDYYFNVKVKDLIHFMETVYSTWDKQTAHKYVDDLFQIDTNKKMGELSTGMKVKLSLAFALSHRAQLLILDEPTSGLDPVVREEIREILFEFSKKHNGGVFFSSHITEDMEKIADRIIFIVNGDIKLALGKKDIYERFRKISLDEMSIDEKKSLLLNRKDHKGSLVIEANEAKQNYKYEQLYLEDVLFYLRERNE